MKPQTKNAYFPLAIILVISAFAHLWNAGYFPAIHPDEGSYMRRAMYTLEGHGVQDPSNQFDHVQTSTSGYDHPYFGQVFLASVFKVIGYPDSLNPKPGDAQSVEMLYLVPRVLMGILAVVDTLIVYKICERRYNRKVAIIASVLFAVMPLGWILRRIVLDSILLPFLLSSILFAVYCNTGSRRNTNGNISDKDIATKGDDDGAKAKDRAMAMAKTHSNSSTISKNNVALAVLSGVFLGLAIFTKIPAFTMIPLVGFVVYKNTKSLRTLALWLLPVILIPAIWPAYAISVGEFGQWMEGVLWQGTERGNEGKTLSDLMYMFFRIDPLLLVLGAAGLAFAAIKRDFLTPLWVIPYLVLVYAVGWATHFHWTLVLPAFCIAGAILIEDLSNRATAGIRNRRLQSVVPVVITCGIAVFGIVATFMLVTANLASPQYGAAAFIAQDVKDNSFGDIDNGVTIISSPAFSWVFKYAFDGAFVFSHIRDSSAPIITNKVILVVDSVYRDTLSNLGEDPKQIALLQQVYKTTYPIAKFRDNAIFYDLKEYPYTSILDAQVGVRRAGIEVKADY